MSAIVPGVTARAPGVTQRAPGVTRRAPEVTPGVTLNPILKPQKKPQRAREALGHKGRASARGADRGEQPERVAGYDTNSTQAPEPDPEAERRKQVRQEKITKACEFWNGHRDAIKEALDERDYKASIHNLIPVEDDGETLTLACHSKLAAQPVETEYGQKLGEIVDRKIKCEQRWWVSGAIRKRDAVPAPPAG